MKRLTLLAVNGVILLVLLAATHLVMGDARGVGAWLALGDSVVEAEGELAGLKAEERYLRHRISLLGLDRVDADMLGELARQHNGLYRWDEIVIPLDSDTNTDALDNAQPPY